MEEVFVKFSKILYPKTECVNNEFFIGAVDKEYPLVFDAMYKIIGYQRHTMDLYTTLSSVKGYAKSIDIDKMYKITIAEKKQGEPWKDKNGNSHPSGDIITVDKIYEIENATSKDFPTCRVQDLKYKNIGLSKDEIQEIFEKFKSSSKLSAARK